MILVVYLVTQWGVISDSDMAVYVRCPGVGVAADKRSGLFMRVSVP
jgi:hypothetical protein